MKKLVSLFLTLILLFTLTSCTKENAEEDNTPIVNPVNLSMEIAIGLEDAQEDGFENIGPKDFIAEEGSTVLEATQLYCMANNISISLDKDMGYITEINGLTEKDYTEMTGWVFTVNGEMPSVGADQLEIQEGDQIRWEFLSFS